MPSSVTIYAKARWIAPLDDYIAQDPEFDQDDILKPMTTSLSSEGKIYGQPFYGESSFLMYRKDVLEAEGVTMPEKPTWDEVAEIAAAVLGWDAERTEKEKENYRARIAAEVAAEEETTDAAASAERMKAEDIV